jgi:hypothetical protein
MFADVTERFGCLECKYFTNNKGSIEKHMKTKKHIEQMKPKALDSTWVHQCLNCFKKCNSQPSLWQHKQKCLPEKNKPSSQDDVLQTILDDNKKILDDNKEMKGMIEQLMKNQQPTNINTTNNNNNNNNNNTINNNINIFLNEKCGNAINMFDFIKSFEFCRDDFESGNLLRATALEHTASIFKKYLDKIILHERPVHSFTGEDPNQMIAHYRHNNEWKKQSEISILDESHRDFDGKDPEDTLMYYLAMFHKDRRTYFDKYFGGKRNHVSPNLNFTTNSQEQYDLSKKVMEIVAIAPDELL